MIGISIAIIALILALAFMFLRAGRRVAALFALPLVSVSVFHLIGWAVHKSLVASAVPAVTLHIAIDALGLLAGLVLCWILARAIDLKRLRYAYFASCAVFLAAMFYAYANHLL